MVAGCVLFEEEIRLVEFVRRQTDLTVERLTAEELGVDARIEGHRVLPEANCELAVEPNVAKVQQRYVVPVEEDGRVGSAKSVAAKRDGRTTGERCVGRRVVQVAVEVPIVGHFGRKRLRGDEATFYRVISISAPQVR